MTMHPGFGTTPPERWDQHTYHCFVTEPLGQMSGLRLSMPSNQALGSQTAQIDAGRCYLGTRRSRWTFHPIFVVIRTTFLDLPATHARLSSMSPEPQWWTDSVSLCLVWLAATAFADRASYALPPVSRSAAAISCRGFVSLSCSTEKTLLLVCRKFTDRGQGQSEHPFQESGDEDLAGGHTPSAENPNGPSLLWPQAASSTTRTVAAEQTDIMSNVIDDFDEDRIEAIRG